MRRDNELREEFRSPRRNASQLYTDTRVRPQMDEVHGREYPHEEPRTNRMRQASVPKSVAYDGKKNWKSFLMKFSMFADSQKWSSQERKTNLCWCLEDKAGEYFARLVQREPEIDYFDILARMESRFDMKELPESAQVYFSYASQLAGETLV